MFSSFSSGKLSDVTGWLQDKSKEAASVVQKSVNDISAGVSEMVVQTPESEATPPPAEGDENAAVAQTGSKNEVLNQVTAKFATDVTKAWGSALSFGKNVTEKVVSSEIVKQASEKVVEVAHSTAKVVENAPILSGTDHHRFQVKFLENNRPFLRV